MAIVKTLLRKENYIFNLIQNKVNSRYALIEATHRKEGAVVDVAVIEWKKNKVVFRDNLPFKQDTLEALKNSIIISLS